MATDFIVGQSLSAPSLTWLPCTDFHENWIHSVLKLTLLVHPLYLLIYSLGGGARSVAATIRGVASSCAARSHRMGVELGLNIFDPRMACDGPLVLTHLS